MATATAAKSGAVSTSSTAATTTSEQRLTSQENPRAVRGPATNTGPSQSGTMLVDVRLKRSSRSASFRLR